MQNRERIVARGGLSGWLMSDEVATKRLVPGGGAVFCPVVPAI